MDENEIINQLMLKLRTEGVSPGVESMFQAPDGPATPGFGGGGSPQPQLQPATIPQAQPDILTQLTQSIDPKMMNQIVGQLHKDILNDKPIGPDVIQGMTGQAGQGGFFGLGIQPTDVLGFALGSLLTRKMPTDQAINTTMKMATLPAQFRQQHRQNLKGLMTQMLGIAHEQRVADRPIAVSGGHLDPKTRTFTRTTPLTKPEMAVQGAGMTNDPNDMLVALGLRQAPQIPGAAAEVAGAVTGAQESAREPFRVGAENRAEGRDVRNDQRDQASRLKIIEAAAAIRRQDPTALAKNVDMVERRLGRKLNEEELKGLLLRSAGGNPIMEEIAAGMRDTRLGGGQSSESPSTNPPKRNLSREAEESLEYLKK